nr:PDR/VanB family oxidoreductase [uncultured Cupriavidus sp.]
MSQIEAATLELMVARRAREAEGIDSFELVHPEGASLPSFTAGAHIVVDILPGLSRAYSLCNDPVERHRYLIAVLLSDDSRGGSAAMHETLVPGRLIRVSVPRNEFELVRSAVRSLLVAGGIGITPILAMAEAQATAGAEFELHYCSRRAEKTAFLSRIHGSRFSARSHIYHDSGPEALQFDAREVLTGRDGDTHVYVCGPAGFIEHVLSTARGLGWDEHRLHREFFTAPVSDADEARSDSSFDLVLASSGKRVHVPCGMSAAAALLEAGIPLSMSCEQGICGTCVTTVLDGTPDHRDHYLTEEDRARNDCFMPCCSRAQTSELLLDL